MALDSAAEMIPLDTLLTGTVRRVGPFAVVTAIQKDPSDTPLHLGFEGFEGDEIGDRKHHGGPEKAVHHYPFDHYAAWRTALGPRDLLDRPGAFGENFSTRGLVESQVAVGDIFRCGQALIQVSQGRQPCWKLNLRFGVSDMALRVQESGRTGWYYRVLESGEVSAGDPLILVDRVAPDWTIERVQRILYFDPLDRDELGAMAALSVLARSLRLHAQRRLETGSLESWTLRLNGPHVLG